MENTIKSFLSIIRLGIGHDADIPAKIDWGTVKAIAEKHGLSAIALDGVKVLIQRGMLTEGLAMDDDLKGEWIGVMYFLYEQKYDQYKKAINHLAKFYNSHGFKMMLLKGYGLSLNYPVPCHRPCGDIDIWLYGQYKEADACLNKEKGIKIDNSHHHHTLFYLDGFLVENHYDIVNIHSGHKNKEMNTLLIKLLSGRDSYNPVPNEFFYLPPVSFNAFFLLCHSMLHFAAIGISLRHVLDWAFFVEKYSSELDWNWLVDTLRHFKMLDYFNCINAICIEDLGFEAGLFCASISEVDANLKNRVLKDIIMPEFDEEEPIGSNIFKRVAFKYRRWQANAWKQRLCYSDNRFVAFWESVWGHLLKPNSI